MDLVESLRLRLDEVMIRDRHRLRRKWQRLRDQVGQDGFEALRISFEDELNASATRLEQRRRALPKLNFELDLPILAYRTQIIESLRHHQVLVVAGETGSGKSTQLPKICLEAGLGVRGMIGHTQPRRIAARTIAARVADELSVPMGREVGLQDSLQ